MKTEIIYDSTKYIYINYDRRCVNKKSFYIKTVLGAVIAEQVWIYIYIYIHI